MVWAFLEGDFCCSPSILLWPLLPVCKAPGGVAGGSQAASGVIAADGISDTTGIEVGSKHHLFPSCFVISSSR